jgi:hypothetical protein
MYLTTRTLEGNFEKVTVTQPWQWTISWKKHAVSFVGAITFGNTQIGKTVSRVHSCLKVMGMCSKKFTCQSGITSYSLHMSTNTDS